MGDIWNGGVGVIVRVRYVICKGESMCKKAILKWLYDRGLVISIYVNYYQWGSLRYDNY